MKHFHLSSVNPDRDDQTDAPVFDPEENLYNVPEQLQAENPQELAQKRRKSKSNTQNNVK